MTKQEYIKEERLRFYLKDEQIYQFYFGDIEIGRKYQSPLRKDENTPSLVFIMYDDKIFWKDFGLYIEDIFHDAIGFVQALCSFQENRKSTRAEAVDTIFEELIKENKAPKKVRKLKDKPIQFYEVEYRELNNDELLFWNKLHIYRRDLDKFNVKAVTGLYRNCNFIRNSLLGDPMYVYLSPFRDTFKTYRPYTKVKGNKFKGVNNGGILEGWEALPKFGDICLINSSLKDTMVNTKAGYPGCNPTSENSFAALESKVREINARFKKTIVFFDNDAAGRKAAARLKYEIGWDNIELPVNWAKDPSDLVSSTKNYFDLIRFLEYKIKAPH